MLSVYPPEELMNFWAEERRHALSEANAGEVLRRSEGKRMVLFVNAGLLRDKDEEHVSPEVVDSLERLSRLVPVALMSKASVRSLQQWFGLPSVSYCGADGLEIRMADDASVIACNAVHCLPALVKGEAELRNWLRSIPGISVERDVFLLSVDLDSRAASKYVYVRTLVSGFRAKHPELRLQALDNRFELMPGTCDVGRRDAVRHVLSRVWSKTESLPVYIGQEGDDGPAFDLVDQSHGVVVEACERPPERASALRIPSFETGEFLREMVGGLT